MGLPDHGPGPLDPDKTHSRGTGLTSMIVDSYTLPPQPREKREREREKGWKCGLFLVPRFVSARRSFFVGFGDTVEVCPTHSVASKPCLCVLRCELVCLLPFCQADLLTATVGRQKPPLCTVTLKHSQQHWDSRLS